MSELSVAPCCGHHLASHDWHEDGYGHQGCGHFNCHCPRTFSEAQAEVVTRHVEAFREQAVAAIEADAAEALNAADHVTLGVIAAISEGKTRAVSIVRDLPR